MDPITLDILVFLAGLLFLIYGADFFIQGCVRLSYLFRLSPLFIGIILVAFGTSTPELAVGITATIKDQKSIALGNIIGSNISNIGLILGLCCLLRPLAVEKSIFKKELPIMVISVALLYVLSWDLVLDKVDGLIFLLLFFLFCLTSYKGSKLSAKELDELSDFKLKSIFEESNSRALMGLLSVVSLVIVILGANLMVNSGVGIAEKFGISPWIIGLTVFAIGTSLPELAASMAAAFRKIPSITVGNVVGSNIFNILLVLGIIPLIRPITISDTSIRIFELPFLFLFSVVSIIFMRTHYKVTRAEGFALLLGYVVFLVFLISR